MVRGAAELIGGGLGVAAAAAELDLGERRFHRLCLRAFGYGPKTLGRILRMNRALERARGDRPSPTWPTRRATPTRPISRAR